MPPRDAPPAMPRWVKVSALVALVILGVGAIVALGGGHGPHMHAPAGGADVGAPADPASADRTVEVALLDTRFDPVWINASKGEVVRFVVRNQGAAPHEFVLGTGEMQAQHAAGMGHDMPHDGAAAMRVLPGEVKELTWRFGEVPLEYACHEPGHYEAGMRGNVTVA